MKLIIQSKEFLSNFDSLGDEIYIDEVSFNGIRLSKDKTAIWCNFDMISSEHNVIEITFCFAADQQDDISLYDNLPVRGLIDHGIPFVMACSTFRRNSDNTYSIDCMNMRTASDSHLYTFNFEFDIFFNIMYILHIILNNQYLDYNIADKYVGYTAAKSISINFENSFQVVEFFAPPKKLFGFKGSTGLALVKYPYENKFFYLYITVSLDKEDYKHFNEAIRNINYNEFLDIGKSIDPENTFIISNKVELEFTSRYNKDHLIEKQCMIGLNMSNTIIYNFILLSVAYNNLTKAIHDAILK